MDEAKRLLTQGWLIKAQRDLATARRLADGPEPLLDTAIYHCQQAAEKAVKGFLLYKDLTFDRTHDVRVLTALAETQEPTFGEWLSTAQLLTPYATAFRYPLDITRIEPNPEEYGRAFQAAEAFLRFVLSLLPSEAQP